MSSRSHGKSLAGKVQRAYSQDDLARVLTMPEREFGAAFGMETVETGRGLTARWQSAEPSGDHFHFRDNGSKVLAVAHLDTVVRPDRRAPRFRNTGTGPLVVSGALDDRLGAYTILKLLPALGITTDLLLTTGEEDGQSTAGDFRPPKDYDHVIEFDRGGTDVVMYQFECAEGRAAVEACGAKMGRGSFSDIAYLEHLGTQAFNWGAGYGGNYHTEKGYAYLHDTFAMTAKYLRFNEQNAGVALKHVPEENDYGWPSVSTSRAYSVPTECEVCWKLVEEGTDFCPECGSCTGCFFKADDCGCYKRHALSGKPVEAAGWREYDEQAQEYNALFGANTF